MVAFELRPVNNGATDEAVDSFAFPRMFDGNNCPFCGEFGEDEFWEQNGEERNELPVELGNPNEALVEVMSTPRIFVCIIRFS